LNASGLLQGIVAYLEGVRVVRWRTKIRDHRTSYELLLCTSSRNQACVSWKSKSAEVGFFFRGSTRQAALEDLGLSK
jgi:hypothetical protein